MYGAPSVGARRLERDVTFQTPRSIISAYISSSLDWSKSAAVRGTGRSFVGTEDDIILGSSFNLLAPELFS